jgi:hypothetical protein
MLDRFGVRFAHSSPPATNMSTTAVDKWYWNHGRFFGFSSMRTPIPLFAVAASRLAELPQLFM